MPAYLLLLAPSSNRVYAGLAPEITRAELEVLAAADQEGHRLVDVDTAQIAGVAYLRATFDHAPPPGLLGRLSAAHAVFEVVETGDDELLRPVLLTRHELLDDDLLTIPKYPGKTNEQLTRTLLNLTLASASGSCEPGRPTCVLDPMAGRGTTLSCALALGCDAVGVEIDRREVEAYAAFLTTWLRRKKLKHQIDLHPLRRHGSHVADVLEAQLSPSREAYATGKRQHLTVYAADTLATADLLERRRVDVVVTDAPYGIRHGSRSGTGRGGPKGADDRDRSPAQLLAAALPVWVSVLRAGGAVGIAWNTHGLRRADLAAMCVAAGLEVRDGGPWLRFAHRVDAGIHRDLLVAVKPR